MFFKIHCLILVTLVIFLLLRIVEQTIKESLSQYDCIFFLGFCLFMKDASLFFLKVSERPLNMCA